MATTKKTPAKKAAPAKKQGWVRWTDADAALVTAKTVELLNQNPTMRRAAAVNEAQQQVLPKARQRNVDEWGHVKAQITLPPELAAQFNKLGLRTAPVAPPEAAPEVTKPHHLLGKGAVRKDGLPRVYWKAPEEDTLAQAVAMALHLGTTKSRITALQLAQSELPENRRRHLESVHSLEWFQPKVDKAMLKIQRAQEKLDDDAVKEAQRLDQVKADEASQRLNKLREADGQDLFALHSAAVAQSRPLPPANVLSDGLTMTLGGLRGVLVTELASIIREAFVHAIKGLSSGEDVGIVAEPQLPVPVEARGHRGNGHDPYGTLNGDKSAPKVRRTSVLVAGLKGAQKGLMEMEFGHLLDLRFCGADQSKDQLRQMSGAADVAVAVTGFISHAHEDIMKARSTHYIKSGGGMDSVRETLQSLVVASQTVHGTVPATH